MSATYSDQPAIDEAPENNDVEDTSENNSENQIEEEITLNSSGYKYSYKNDVHLKMKQK